MAGSANGGIEGTVRLGVAGSANGGIEVSVRLRAAGSANGGIEVSVRLGGWRVLARAGAATPIGGLEPLRHRR